MRDVGLTFTGGFPAWGALGLSCLAAALIYWAYRRNRERLSRSQAIALPLLRGGLLLLLLGCLVEPVLSYRTVPHREAPVAFLVDVSKSMSIADAGGPDAPRSRLQAAIEPWIGGGRLASKLERRFSVHYFAFDASTRPVAGRADLAQQEAAGEMTLVGEALASAKRQTGSDDLAGMVLLTDGADHSGADPMAMAREVATPVYVVAVGEVQASFEGKPDLAVVDVQAERFMSVNADNEVTVTLDQRGFDAQTATVEVLDGDQLMTSETVELAGAQIEIQLQIRPADLGKRTFEVRARPFDTEELLENNRRKLSAIVEKRHLAVLYVEGTPRWEYKFLKRTFERDPVVQFTGFVRGRSDLFVRQGERVGQGVLPVSVEGFDPFDVILIGDVSPALFSATQLEAIRDAVRDHGKGLVLIPGPRVRDDGGFGRTALSEVLPAWLTDDESYTTAGDFVPRLSVEGRDHPVCAGLDALLTNSRATPLPGCFVLTPPRPGASVVAVHSAREARDGHLLPLCVVQRVGEGRAMTMGLDGTWHWRMGPKVNADTRALHTRLWGQAVRWLAGRDEDAPGDMPFIAYASRDYYEAGEVSILYARLGRQDKDETEAPPEAALAAEPEVTAEVRAPSGALLNTPLERVAGSAGLYKAQLSFTDPGEYVAKVTAVQDAAPVGEDTAAFFIGRPYGEFDQIEMNERLLRNLAFETGGAFYTPQSASRIPEDMVAVASRRGVFVEREFARMPGVYLAMVVCATIEWFLRKRRGLM